MNVPPIDHDDICYLSRNFNAHCGSARHASAEYRINEWLKAVITKALEAKQTASRATSRQESRDEV